jgi:hypothetical protein
MCKALHEVMRLYRTADVESYGGRAESSLGVGCRRATDSARGSSRSDTRDALGVRIGLEGHGEGL